MTINVYNIEWDTDQGPNPDYLPDEATVTVKSEDDIPNALRNLYGYDVLGYDIPIEYDDFGNEGEGRSARHDL